MTNVRFSRDWRDIKNMNQVSMMILGILERKEYEEQIKILSEVIATYDDMDTISRMISKGVTPISKRDFEDRCYEEGNTDREKIIKTIRALEVYMLISSIALGLLQILALKSYESSKMKLFTRYLRTKSNKVSSGATIAHSMRIEFFQRLAQNRHLDIPKIIFRSKIKPLIMRMS